uniref:Uncharacterized protein n=1 Tax=Lepeophtheirus salmonis TaxID=72036 RepID=A0A0K2TFV7_LEPSM
MSLLLFYLLIQHQGKVFNCPRIRNNFVKFIHNPLNVLKVSQLKSLLLANREMNSI